MEPGAVGEGRIRLLQFAPALRLEGFLGAAA
jgi:hypothetical protein